ncbi:hypothetical protein SAMN05660297_02254 [Natronincola peptidivorans]|uniref:Uncharacterized protein n=1 Tax=Natronincola peptidivorans TaxID=426128 RepID=A0A1I0E2J1_9FIRM|nr:hypothetical protein SAMN05660297_02254 [Natronincola peptidivorans]
MLVLGIYSIVFLTIVMGIAITAKKNSKLELFGIALFLPVLTYVCLSLLK